MNKKSFSLVLAISILSAMGYAQANLDKEVDSELNKMYSAQVQPEAAKPAEAAKSTASQSPAAPVSGQPIYILNQATPTANSQSTSAAAAVQKQPTTVIEASPLTESRAESLRKARQDAETSTEAKIVEKLEQSRLDDEKRRAQVLFGDKLNAQQQEEAKAVAPAAAPAQAVQPQIIIIPQQAAPVVASPVVPVVAPATPTVAPAVPEKKAEEAKVEEVKDAKVEKEVKAAEKAEGEMAMNMPAPELEKKSQKYMSALVGVPSVDRNYVTGNYSLGLTFGNKYDDNFAVEGSFIYSNYEVQNVGGWRDWYTNQYDKFDVNQYSGAVTGKWYLLPGMVKPVIGGIAQYSYREFQWSDKNLGSVNPGNSNSSAVDLGILAGVEVEFSKNMNVGLDMRYMKNVLVRRNYSTDNLNNNYQQNMNNYYYGYRTPIEDVDYYTISLSTRVTF
jgi:hypothetical protein